MINRQRVVVTGLGVVTAAGTDEASVWSSLFAGRTGITAVRHHDLSANIVRNGAEVDAAALEASLPPSFRRADRCLKFAFEASRQAMSGSGHLIWPPQETQDIASIWGCGAGQTEILQAAHQRFFERGPKGMRPSTIPNGMANALAANISIAFQITGTNYVITSACTSSTNALGIAFRMIGDGHADAVLCGGADTPFNPFHYACWNNLGVLDAQEQRWTDARAAFEKALALASDHPKALGNLAALDFREGRHAEADSLARRALRVGGEEPETLYNAAVVLGNLGHPDLAYQGFHALVLRQPWNSAARAGEVRALLALGRRDEALAYHRSHPADRQTPELESLARELEP